MSNIDQYDSINSIFGPIFDGSVLTRSVLATLKAWFPVYIKEIEIQRGWTPGLIPPPRTYVERWRFDTYPDEQLPIVVVVSPGMADAPTATGDGIMSAWWMCGVGVIAAANTEDNSERLAKVYGAAARAIIEQKSYLDDTWEYSGTQVVTETYEDVPDIEQSRTMRSVHVICRIMVDNIMTKGAGPYNLDPPDPDTQPGDDWYEVLAVFVDINNIPFTDPMPRG
jgi:hypothetical protein